MTWVYFLKEKSEAFSVCKKFKIYIEKQSKEQLKVLRTVRGAKFLLVEFYSFIEELSIKR